MRKMLPRLILISALLLLTVAAASAQGDTDGDGVPDRIDRCPNEPGPRENDGCPLPTSTPVPQQPQPQPTETPLPTATPTATLIPPAFIAPDGPCAVSPRGARANIREYPSTDAEVVGQLLPGTLYVVTAIVYLDTETWFAVDDGWVSGVAVVAGGLCGEVPRLEAPGGGIVDSSKYDDVWPEEWGDPHKGLAFDFPDEDGGTFLKYKLEDVIISSITDGTVGDPHALALELENVLISSYQTGADGTKKFTGGYLLADWDKLDNVLIIAVLPDPEGDDPGGTFAAQLLGDGSVKIGDFNLLLPATDQGLLLPAIQQGLLLPALEQDDAPGVMDLPSLELLIDRNDAGAGGGPHVKVFDGATGQHVNITDGTSNTLLPPDPGNYNREHVLLARQFGAPAAADGSVVPGDGSVVPGDGSVVPGDGSVMPSLVLSFGVGDPTGMGLLLPAVQKVRAAF